jgi:hypothetical protein
MSDDYSYSEKRNKRKDKFKKKKFFPYKHGGKWRSTAEQPIINK